MTGKKDDADFVHAGEFFVLNFHFSKQWRPNFKAVVARVLILVIISSVHFLRKGILNCLKKVAADA